MNREETLAAIKLLEIYETELFRELAEAESGLAYRGMSVIQAALDEVEGEIEALKDELNLSVGGGL